MGYRKLANCKLHPALEVNFEMGSSAVAAKAAGDGDGVPLLYGGVRMWRLPTGTTVVHCTVLYAYSVQKQPSNM